MYISRFFIQLHVFCLLFFKTFFSFIYIVLLSMGLSISQLWKIAEHLRQSIGTLEKKANFKGRKMEPKARTRVHSNKGYISCTEWNPSSVVTWYSREFQCCLCSLRWRSSNKHYFTSTKFCIMTCPVTCWHRIFSQYWLIICRSAKNIRIFILVLSV